MTEKITVKGELEKFTKELGITALSEEKSKLDLDKEAKRKAKKEEAKRLKREKLENERIRKEEAQKLEIAKKEKFEQEQKKKRETIIQANKLRIQKRLSEEKTYKLINNEEILLKYCKINSTDTETKHPHYCSFCGDILYDENFFNYMKTNHPNKLPALNRFPKNKFEYYCYKCNHPFDKLESNNRDILKTVLVKLKDYKERLDFQAELFNKINRILNELKLKVYE